MIQKIQFRKLMDAIKDNNMYKQKGITADYCSQSDSFEGDENLNNAMYGTRTKGATAGV